MATHLLAKQFDYLRWALMVSAVCLGWWLSPRLLRAEDEIEIQNANKSGSTKVRGEIERLDERGAVLKLANGKLMKYDIERVKAPRVQISPKVIAAEESLAKHQYSAAATSFQAALDDPGAQPWLIERARLGLVKSYLALNDLLAASNVFIRWAASSTDEDILVYAPLAWKIGHKPNEVEAAQAKRWILDAEKPIEQLIAASWLLEVDETNRAEKVLDQMETVSDARGLGWLARGQRYRLAENARSSDHIKQLEALLERTPRQFRSGTQLVYGQCLDRLNRPADAAIAFLWIPFVYQRSPRHNPEALLLAAQSAKKAKMNQDAEKLFKQVINDFPGTDWANRAVEASKLKP